ncbi:MAG: IS3 family transposase [Mycobacterium sp.]|nr:IS3 family transposase [Mycobacterium sp.]
MGLNWIGTSGSNWFYKWINRQPTPTQRRRGDLARTVHELFEASGRACGSPRVHADLVAAGWRVSVNTVAESMRRQGLAGRKPKRRKGLTKQDRAAPKFPDLLRRDFTAPAPNHKWCGDMTQIPPTKARYIWPRCWTCIPVDYWPAPPRNIQTRNWPAMRSRSLSPSAAAAMPSTV